MSEPSSSQPSPPPTERYEYSRIKEYNDPALKARGKAIFEFIKSDCVSRVLEWEANKTDQMERKTWILENIYPMVDEKFSISGEGGFKVGDFQAALSKTINNQIREVKKKVKTSGTPLPSATGGGVQLTVKVTDQPRQRKKNGLDVFKMEQKDAIKAAVSKTKEKGKEEEMEGEMEGKEEVKKSKGESLAHWNQVAAKLFEAIDADTKEGLETKAADLNAARSRDLTPASLIENQDNLGNWAHKTLSRMIGDGPKQAGDVCFFLRYAMRRPDGSIKYMRLSVTSSSNPKIRFEDEEEQSVVFKTWAKSVLDPETAPEEDIDMREGPAPAPAPVPAPAPAPASPPDPSATAPSAPSTASPPAPSAVAPLAPRAPPAPPAASPPVSPPLIPQGPAEDLSPSSVKSLAVQVERAAGVGSSNGGEGGSSVDGGPEVLGEDIMFPGDDDENPEMVDLELDVSEENADCADEVKHKGKGKKTVKRAPKKATRGKGKGKAATKPKQTTKKSSAAAVTEPGSEAGKKRKRVDDETSDDGPAKKKGKQSDPVIEAGPSVRPTRLRAPPKARAAPGSPVVKVTEKAPAQATGKGKKK